MEKNKSQHRDYRFDLLAYALRKENSRCYSFSRQAAWNLYGNDSSSVELDEVTWDSLWKELHHEYGEKFR